MILKRPRKTQKYYYMQMTLKFGSEKKLRMIQKRQQNDSDAVYKKQATV